MAFYYGTIVQVTRDVEFAKTGDRFKVIVEEGDGTIGLLKHSLCYKLNDQGKAQADYLYELSWADMKDISEDWMAESIRLKMGPLEEEMKMLQSKMESLRTMRDKFQKPTSEYLKDFHSEIMGEEDVPVNTVPSRFRGDEF